MTHNTQGQDLAVAALTQGTATARSMGSLIAEANSLSAEQLEQILAHQKATGLKFGEAAVALGMARGEDILWALGQQFHYPVSPGGESRLAQELVVARKPFGEQAEAFRVLRSQLNMRLFSPGAPRRAIAVLSPDSGDGKSFFAANLAVAFSQLGGRTLLIDADMRSPRQQEIFAVEDAQGLSSILSGRVTSEAVRPVRELPGLFVLPVGTLPPNPSELVERPAFGLLVQELLGSFDQVIVDTPSASFGADAAVIAARCGAALLLARKGRSRLGALQHLQKTLGHGPALVAGVVLNEH